MIKRFVPALVAVSILAGSPVLLTEAGAQVSHPQKAFGHARELLDRGMFNRSEKIFNELISTGAKSDAEGYSILCEVKMRAKGYENRMLKYLEKHPYSVMVPAIRYQYAMNLFDVQEYDEAAVQFEQIPVKQVRKDLRPAYVFYKSYSQLEAGKVDDAVEGFREIDGMKESDFTAPARYTLGYLAYENSEFKEALKWFGDAADDSRFQEMSLYYIIECRFLLQDYDYVIEYGPKIFEKANPSRKSQLSRFISEAYLVKDEADKAREYFEYSNQTQEGEKTRSDWFYAGSLHYQLEDYAKAVDCFEKMDHRTDSLGQVANYHLGYSYIRLRNKVAALDAFKAAAMEDYNASMKEDAYFNYAKLAFDLNSDTSVFYDYLKRYTDKKKGDRIYSYIAVAALYSNDYQAAIEAYDHIDEFDDDMRGNYVKSNFLRASQLIGKGSWRSAIPCLRAITFYTRKDSSISLLTRYWLAESYFRTGEYGKAISTYTELYNLSAFYGKPEYDNLLYGLAYCHFKQEHYPQAVKWLDEYLAHASEGHRLQFRKDALVRKGDCLYITKDYKGAYKVYDEVLADYFEADDIYPYYQSAISHGLAGETQKKISILENVKKADPEANYYPDAMYELGRSYVAVRQDEKAFDCFRLLAETSANANFKAKAYLEMGMLARNNGKVDEAIDYYKYIVENIKETDYSEEALLAMEAVYKSIHQPEVYLDYIASIGKGGMKTEDEKEDMLFNAAEHIYAGGNYEKALVSLQNFLKTYPASAEEHKVEYYIAESYKNLGQLELASDYYRKVMDGGEGTTLELAVLNYAEISYGFDKFDEAYEAYAKLASSATLANNKSTGRIGMMRSAFFAHDTGKTIHAAQDVLKSADGGSEIAREAKWCMAKAYMSSSHRDDAMDIFRSLAERPTDRFGAEASYWLIQNFYDLGDFAKVEEGVYAFADSGTGEMYWLAKAFIVLGDAFVEQGNIKQAKATYASVRDSYTSDRENDDTIGNVELRLNKLASLEAGNTDTVK